MTSITTASSPEGDGITSDTLPLVGSEYAPTINENEVIAGLALLNPMDYDRARKEQAKLLGVQVKTLDAQVKSARNETDGNENNLPFPDVEPHEDPVDPCLLYTSRCV